MTQRGRSSMSRKSHGARKRKKNSHLVRLNGGVQRRLQRECSKAKTPTGVFEMHQREVQCEYPTGKSPDPNGGEKLLKQGAKASVVGSATTTRWMPALWETDEGKRTRRGKTGEFLNGRKRKEKILPRPTASRIIVPGEALLPMLQGGGTRRRLLLSS